MTRQPTAAEPDGRGGVVGIMADIDVVEARLREVRDLAADPDRAADEQRVYDVSIRWGAVLCGRLQRLDHYASRGKLAPAEATRYRELLAALAAALPLIDRLGLGRPPVPLPDGRTAPSSGT